MEPIPLSNIQFLLLKNCQQNISFLDSQLKSEKEKLECMLLLIKDQHNITDIDTTFSIDEVNKVLVSKPSELK